jgi:hypothetical protein
MARGDRDRARAKTSPSAERQLGEPHNFSDRQPKVIGAHFRVRNWRCLGLIPFARFASRFRIALLGKRFELPDECSETRRHRFPHRFVFCPEILPDGEQPRPTILL